MFKFNDRNGNGVHNPPIEIGLAGWNFNFNPGPPNPVTTGASGSICFTVPAPGTYTVTEQVQPGWTPTTANPQTVAVQPGQLLNLNFGNKTAVVGTCDLAIKKSATPNPVQSGGQVTVSLAVTNVGAGPCSPGAVAIQMQDIKPAGLIFNPTVVVVVGSNPQPAAGPWNCSFIGGNLSCPNYSTLQPGYQVTFTFTATVTAPAGSTIQNCATVTSLPGDANQTNNLSCVTINVGSAPPPTEWRLPEGLTPPPMEPIPPRAVTPPKELR